MKKKLMFTSLAVLTMAAAGVIGVQQPVSASGVSEIKEQRVNNTPAVKSAYLEHYNVLRIELAKSFIANSAYLQLQHGNYMSIGTPVLKEGAIIAFDVNLDSFARNYTTQEEKEAVVKSLNLRYITFDGVQNDRIKIEDKFARKTLLNATDQGEVLTSGYVDTVANLKMLGSYDKVISQDAYGDHLLEKKITNQTKALGFEVNSAYLEGYDYLVTDKDGKVSGTVKFHQNDMFVSPMGETFANQEYNISAKNKKTNKILNIAKFTPFNLF